MYRWSRRVVNQFAGDEQLFRRYRRSDLVNGQIVSAALRFPKTAENTGPSVNRSRFGRPEDALWDESRRYNGWGVFAFPVSCLPEELRASDYSCTVFPKHIPLPKNYAHTEIWSDLLPDRTATYVCPPPNIRKELRAIISQNAHVIIGAQI
jgi:hypothetical protein